MYPHAHHVMSRIRRHKKKTSISEDDEGKEDGPDADNDLANKKKKHKNKLPTIEDDEKAEVCFCTCTCQTCTFQ